MTPAHLSSRLLYLFQFNSTSLQHGFLITMQVHSLYSAITTEQRLLILFLMADLRDFVLRDSGHLSIGLQDSAPQEFGPREVCPQVFGLQDSVPRNIGRQDSVPQDFGHRHIGLQDSALQQAEPRSRDFGHQDSGQPDFGHRVSGPRNVTYLRIATQLTDFFQITLTLIREVKKKCAYNSTLSKCSGNAAMPA